MAFRRSYEIEFEAKSPEGGVNRLKVVGKSLEECLKVFPQFFGTIKIDELKKKLDKVKKKEEFRGNKKGGEDYMHM